MPKTRGEFRIHCHMYIFSYFLNVRQHSDDSFSHHYDTLNVDFVAAETNAKFEVSAQHHLSEV